jgi:excisionase family DNA binding protein
MRARNDNVVPLRLDLDTAVLEDIPVRTPHKVALFTRHTLASYLNVHVNTVDRLVARGELTAYRIAGKRRFYPEDVERHIHAHHEKPR